MKLKEKIAAWLRRLADRLSPLKVEEPEENVKTIDSGEAVLIRSMLSHNVRMPLSIISGYGDLLQKGVIRDEEKKIECINKICGNIRYLSNVLSLIIDGNERTGLSYSFTDMNLVDCVKETAEYVKETAKRYKVRVQVNHSQKEVLVRGDYTQIMRVIFNLFENSVKYMGRPGNIVITIDETEPGKAMIIYRDDGLGMDSSEAARILEKGYRGSNSTSGTGMGMYYVNEVIKKHGGSVNIISEIGKGMNVYMKFDSTKCEEIL